MATLNEISALTGVTPGRTIGEQVYDDQQINNQYSDVAPGDFGYTGNIQKNSDFYDPFHSNFQKLTQPISNTFNKYAPQVTGGIMSLVSGIPGLGFVMNGLSRLKGDPYARNLRDMYGGYGEFGDKDKFGYNVNSFANNYMTPGSNSFRSHALAGLGSLDQNLANSFYQENYGLNFGQVKDAIRSKENPFGPQPVNIGTSDYYGGDDTSESSGAGGGDFGDSVNDPGGFSNYS
tara:strand:- start:43 stop:741 length:699 start_codon:yes stop_codon:yes gene_type:complete